MKEYNLKHVPGYHSLEYAYGYDFKTKQGKLIAKGVGREEVLEIKGDVARKIHALLFYNERKKDFIGKKQSDCHVTADYIAGLGNNIGNVRESFDERKNKLLQGAKQFKSIQDATKELKYPFLCRVVSDEGIAHSFIVVGKLSDNTIIGFEQRGEGYEWGFCETQKSISVYRGECVFCIEIETV